MGLWVHGNQKQFSDSCIFLLIFTSALPTHHSQPLKPPHSQPLPSMRCFSSSSSISLPPPHSLHPYPILFLNFSSTTLTDIKASPFSPVLLSFSRFSLIAKRLLRLQVCSFTSIMYAAYYNSLPESASPRLYAFELAHICDPTIPPKTSDPSLPAWLGPITINADWEANRSQH